VSQKAPIFTPSPQALSLRSGQALSRREGDFCDTLGERKLGGMLRATFTVKYPNSKADV